MYTIPTTEAFQQIPRNTIARLMWIATCVGRNPEVTATKFQDHTDDELHPIIATLERECRNRGTDLRTSDERTATPAAPATDRQVDYICKLLVRRDTGQGFSGIIASLYSGQRIDRTRVSQLTKVRASEVIESLTEQY